jgi:hypothetical protein
VFLPLSQSSIAFYTPLPFLFVLGFNTGTLSQIFRFKKIEIASQISILALSPEGFEQLNKSM